MTGAADLRPILIRQARMIDPARRLDFVGDILLRGGEISAVERSIEARPDGCLVIDGAGLVASPGFIDLHVHLREPGYEYKETIVTGSQAAARGGFTTICCMPNTEPPIDSESVVEFVLRRAAEAGLARVLPIGCVSHGRKGKELADLEELAASGAVGFSDDGDAVEDANLMRMALTYSTDLGRPVVNHCQDMELSGSGVMAEGPVATHLGLPGIPPTAEDAMIARDISLAAATGGLYHVAHVSTAGSVPLVRRAKEMGLNVTAEVCPHHLTITDEWALGARGAGAVRSEWAYDTYTKVYPPLRSQADTEALVEALADGTIDCIATDHAPHDVASKQVTYQDAAFGISALETALGSALQLVHSGRVSLPALVERLTTGPAGVLGKDYAYLASLAPGTTADVVLFDPNLLWTVDSSEFASKGKNTPLDGTELKGCALATIYGGKLVYQGKELRVQDEYVRA